MRKVFNARALLLVGALCVLCGLGNYNAKATEMNVSTVIDSVLSMTLLKDYASLSITPTDDGAVNYDYVEAVVSTNNETGYTITMSTESTSLKNSAVSQSAIESIDQNGVTLNQFGNNKWGYGLNADIFSPVLMSQTLRSTDSEISDDSTKVYFGAKVDTSIPSGKYSDILTISAVPNVTPEYRSLSDLGSNGEVAMQDFSDEICMNTDTPAAYNTDGSINLDIPSAVLTDSRDGNKYKIYKYADGNCWMAENLRLDLNNNVALTSVDSDINSVDEWIPLRSTGEWSDNYKIPSSTVRNEVYFYNWTAAIASNDSSDYDWDEDITAPDSICPRGWRLPSRFSEPLKSFGKLTNTYSIEGHNTAALRNAPFDYKAWGYIGGDGKLRDNEGSDTNFSWLIGSLWEGDSGRSGGAYRIQVYNAYFLHDIFYKVNGQAVRCVAR